MRVLVTGQARYSHDAQRPANYGPLAALHAEHVGFVEGSMDGDRRNTKARQAPGFALEDQVQNIE